MNSFTTSQIQKFQNYIHSIKSMTSEADIKINEGFNILINRENYSFESFFEFDSEQIEAKDEFALNITNFYLIIKAAKQKDTIIIEKNIQCDYIDIIISNEQISKTYKLNIIDSCVSHSSLIEEMRFPFFIGSKIFIESIKNLSIIDKEIMINKNDNSELVLTSDTDSANLSIEFNNIKTELKEPLYIESSYLLSFQKLFKYKLNLNMCIIDNKLLLTNDNENIKFKYALLGRV